MGNNLVDAALPGLNSIVEPGLGRAEVRRLDWDCEFFGREMGAIRVDVSAASEYRQRAGHVLLESVNREARASGFEHLIYRVDGNDWPAVHGAQANGWLVVDVSQDLALRCESPGGSQQAISGIRDALPQDLPALQEIAGRAFTFSRFAADPFFSTDEVRAFHQQWITNLASGAAQAVLAHEVNGALSGFIACSLQDEVGRIVLVASDAAYRRQGVGAALVNGALRWFSNAGARIAYVKTQSANIPALALYQNAGFQPHQCEITLSINLRETQRNEGNL